MASANASPAVGLGAGKKPRKSNLAKDVDLTKSVAVETQTELPPTVPNTPTPEPSSPEPSDKKSKKRKRNTSHPSPFDSDSNYRCLILKNVNEDIYKDLMDNMLIWIAECQEEMSSDDGEEQNPDVDIEEIPIDRVRILLSEEQKRENKTRYREEYAQRPDVIEKRKAKESDPNTKAKRDSYQKLPKVQAQKKVRTQVRQKVLRVLKKTDPKKYKELESKVLQSLTCADDKEDSEVQEPAAKRQKTESGMDLEVA